MRHDVEDGGGAPGVAERGQRNVSSVRAGTSPEEMQKRMEAAGTPGPAHKALDALAGSWKAEVKCWHEPGSAPQVSQGTAKTRWILNGHFLEEEFNGEMMGKAFTGRSLMGYDNTKEQYQMTWVSDMQTSIFVTAGKGDQGNHVITLEGRSDCPGTGQRDIPMKSIFRILSRDKHIFEMHDGSKNMKVMEITYTRA